SRLCLQVPAPVAGSAFGLVFAVLYGLIAGWGVPAQRTVFMLLALFIGQLRGGLQSSWDTFFLALFLVPSMALAAELSKDYNERGSNSISTMGLPVVFTRPYQACKLYA
ncbi:MAG: ComEC/Rec2 family competence protein, partial [Burkholderiaceae bacterium]|nr:ComEC/Rec2 family competence protein [Burkholderiaceae bacterium]